MRAPAFWWQEQLSPLAIMLAPVGAIYGGIAGWRMNRHGARAPLPVICVGNFVAGGAGKTPAAIALGTWLASIGERPAFILRGYGSAASHSPAARLVDAARDVAASVGDEALLLARVAPTFVGADRRANAAAAADAGATVVVMDDGLQNASLHKDLAIAMVDGKTGVGNELCIPAGPLRAKLDAQMAHVDALIVVGAGASGVSVAARARARDRPVYTAELVPDAARAAELKGRRVVAFAGIGNPQKFFATLAEIGADIVATRGFADHYAFSDAEIEALRRQAGAERAMLVTTEKDWVRLPALAPIDLPAPVALPITLRWSEAAGIEELLVAALESAREQVRVSS